MGMYAIASEVNLCVGRLTAIVSSQEAVLDPTPILHPELTQKKYLISTGIKVEDLNLLLEF
jgi:hypothetical protein